MTLKNRSRRVLLGAALLLPLSGYLPLSVAWSKPGTSYLTMRFALSGISGNPFDYRQNDIQVELAGSGGKTFVAPAFYDGGENWELRCTPPVPGTWTVKRITRNGTAIATKTVSETTFMVDGGSAGFIGRDPKQPAFFAYANGTPYYPMGCNVAWNSGEVTVEGFLADMGASGQNWARVWMNHWDNKNLDWVMGQKLAPEMLDLTVARRWDGIVAVAEQNKIAFQLVFQHHGQYSKRVNPNWDDNPWNTKNGGFLAEPHDFFTDDTARRLTKTKYRYFLARWGYSSSILAWELFNEVQFTDAGQAKDHAAIAAWHKEMATFVREQDVHHHLVTTSSDDSITGLYDAMDYRQPHDYPSDVIASIRRVGDEFAIARGKDAKAVKPVFFGEIGTGNVDLSKDDGTYLHQILWAGVLSPAAGAAQYWTWDNVSRRKLTGAWRPATDFVRVFRLPARRDMIPARVELAQMNQGAGAVSFGPGGGWGEVKQTRYDIDPATGDAPGTGSMSPYLQGTNNKALFPFAEFAVRFDKPGTLAVRFRQISKNGANVIVSVDGKPVTEKSFPAAATDTPTDTVLTVAVPAGAHVVRLENTGTDWAQIERITLTPYGSPLKFVAKADKESVAAWLYAADPAQTAPLSGTIRVPGLDAGRYTVYFWDTRTGKVVRSESAKVDVGKPLVVKTPPIEKDIALFAAHERTGKYTP